MKKTSILYLAMMLCFSCNEEIAPSLDTKAANMKVMKDMQVSRGSIDYSIASTTCGIDGCAIVPANCTTSYTYWSDAANNTVAWSVTGGDITLIGGQGSLTATFQFGVNFSGGSIRGIGSGGELCEENITIASVTPPVITAQLVSGPGEPTDYHFTATPVSGVTYNWYVNGVLTASGSGNSFDWYFPCNVSKTIKCTIVACNCETLFSNSITKTGACIRT